MRRHEGMRDEALEYAIKKVQENWLGLRLNETLQFLSYGDDFNILGDNRVTIKENTETVIDASKEDGIRINVDNIYSMLLSRHQNAGQSMT
jgi:hypothetical protein